MIRLEGWDWNRKLCQPRFRYTADRKKLVFMVWDNFKWVICSQANLSLLHILWELGSHGIVFQLIDNHFHRNTWVVWLKPVLQSLNVLLWGKCKSLLGSRRLWTRPLQFRLALSVSVGSWARQLKATRGGPAVHITTMLCFILLLFPI